MITLHHLNQSRSLRIVWLLEELGVDYSLVRYTRDTKTRLAPQALRDVHPLGKSPVVEFHGTIVTESAAIVETVCAAHAPQMIPLQSSPEFTQHLELMHFAEGSAMTPILLNLYVGLLGAAGAPLHPRISSELDNHFAYMEACLRPSGHYVLDALSAVDIMMSFPAQVAMRLGRREDFPVLADFVDRLEARPAWIRAKQKAGGD